MPINGAALGEAFPEWGTARIDLGGWVVERERTATRILTATGAAAGLLNIILTIPLYGIGSLLSDDGKPLARRLRVVNRVVLVGYSIALLYVVSLAWLGAPAKCTHLMEWGVINQDALDQAFGFGHVSVYRLSRFVASSEWATALVAAIAGISLGIANRKYLRKKPSAAGLM